MTIAVTKQRAGCIGLWAAFVALSVASNSLAGPERLSPAEEVKRFTIAEGLEANLFASEPLIRQPVSISFDDRGRMWVLQYIQYPIPEGLKPVEVDRYLRTKYDRVPKPPPHGPKGVDKIAILEDSDGDGRADVAKEFLTELNLASGMALGHGGVFVVQSPYLLFYPDRDRNDLPDSDPKVLLEGFGMNDAHAFANSLTWGPDGWLYGAQGSTVSADIRGIKFQQGVWRYHPLTDRFELFAEGGGNTWGIDFDRFGNLFSGGNTVEPLCHHVQGAYYVKGFGKHGPLHNPYSFGYFLPVKHHGYVGDSLTGGFVLYQGGAFPERFDHACIAPNSRHSAMRWNTLEERGSTFATRFGGDFITSADIWFRPVDSLVGPDGALYVADWYDYNISHSSPKDRSQWYMPSRQDGRIWKVSAKEAPADKNAATLTSDPLNERTAEQLVALMSHPNVWYARHARRILAERRDERIVGLLKDRVLAETDELRALKALWSLYVSDGFDEALAEQLLAHRFAEVRSWTVRLLGDEQRISGSLQKQLVALARSEPSRAVRSQLACTAKRLPAADALPIISELLRHSEDTDDPFIPLLLWWAIEDKTVSDRVAVLKLIESPEAWKTPLIRTTIIERLARRYLAEESNLGIASTAYLLELAMRENSVELVVQAMEQQLQGRRLAVVGSALEQQIVALLGREPNNPLLIRLALRLGIPQAGETARRLIAGSDTPEHERTAVIRTIGETAQAEGPQTLLPLLGTDSSEPVRLAVLSALERFDEQSIPTAVLSRYPNMSSKLRGRTRELLCSRQSWAHQFIDAVDAGTIDPKHVSLDLLRRMVRHGDTALNERITKQWGSIRSATPREKQGRIQAITQMLSRGTADGVNGKILFTKHCGTCHRLFEEGIQIGPDLTGADRKNLALFLLNIVDPNAVMREQYRSFVVATTDGRVLTGLMAESTPQTVTILDAKNQKTVLSRSEIDDLKEADVSLMPEKILYPLTEQEIRDLFAYLRRDKPMQAAAGK
jgi:putative heme-binding domain-containing protein